MGEEQKKVIAKSGSVILTDPDGILGKATETTSKKREDEVVTIEEARLACRIDGNSNDQVILPIKEAAEAYVIEAVGANFKNDKRARQAVLLLIQIIFRPEDDAQGNLKQHLTGLLRQMGTFI